ncbi:uncharacterized protein EV420DRAFT_1485124 [Desarmillaria tabescens]|uniref:Uncharacterized protein n=1 Tax=Armillaria tabescens TaxID=1929756 RepID=A0AA39MR69_ARMTA|nr:uncharacterized protein EV420DRAFT_1485124 [Desarmillaria tabescens]KAK0443014.1 hypothetical protein EV420DRAFT_1485124 [Desarmillaria tabescens]
MITNLFAAYSSTSPRLPVYAVSHSRVEATVLSMESHAHSGRNVLSPGNDMGFCLIQEYEKQLLAALQLKYDQRAFQDNINDYAHTVSDGHGRAWQSLFLSRFIALYPDTVQSLQVHLEEEMDYERSGLAKDGHALEQHMLLPSTQQASEGLQDEQSVDAERVTVEGSVSDESDGTVDSGTTAWIRSWRVSAYETTDSVVDKDFESRLSLVVELKEQRDEARRAAIALWVATVFEAENCSV